VASALPHWPGMMRRATAALYCELSVSEFEREINAGRLPMPVKLGNHEHWSKARLDEALDRLTADNGNWFDGSPLYGDAA
jgi:predicted DNA-binding transcriptional regulator AlpA